MRQGRTKICKGKRSYDYNVTVNGKVTASPVERTGAAAPAAAAPAPVAAALPRLWPHPLLPRAPAPPGPPLLLLPAAAAAGETE